MSVATAFEKARAEDRAALVGYLPAGFPTVDGSIDAIRVLADAGCDVIEVGLPYSDPVMDGPTIQAAAQQALDGGVRIRDVLHTVEAVAATGTPTVVVLIGGSAITMSPWIEQVAAVIDAWYPGEQGGPAVADVIFGAANPSGRLPITFPVSEGQLPLSYNHKPTGRGDDYVDLTGMALFPFGHGLSYTTFKYSNLRIDKTEISANESTTVRGTVTNNGSREGDEVVQLYIRDDLASVAQPQIALKGFTRVHLRPGQSADVAFEVGPRELRLLDANLNWVVEPGAFRVMIGASSKDIRLRGQLVVR